MSGFRYTVGSRKFTRTRKSLKKFSFTTTGATGIDTNFDKTKDCVVEIKPLNEHAYLRPEYLVIQLSDISAGTDAITIRITTDTAGDIVFFPDTQATISDAISGGGVGTVAYSLQLPFVDTTDSATSFYLFAKTDASGEDVNITSADLYCTVETF